MAFNKKEETIITIDPNMRDYTKDPFFVKKAKKARAFIAKHGLPKRSGSQKGK